MRGSVYWNTFREDWIIWLISTSHSFKTQLIRLHYIFLPKKLLQRQWSKILTTAIFSFMDRRSSISHVWSFATLVTLTARRHNTTTLRDPCRHRWRWHSEDVRTCTSVKHICWQRSINVVCVPCLSKSHSKGCLSIEFFNSCPHLGWGISCSDEFPIAGGCWKSISWNNLLSSISNGTERKEVCGVTSEIWNSTYFSGIVNSLF